MTISTYSKRLTAGVASGGRTVFENLCFDIEYDQLSSVRWSRELFHFFVEVLRDPVICGLVGSDSFVRTLYHDFEKLSPEDREVLLEVFNQEADNFGDEQLRHSISDLIARKYEPEVALRTFTEWMRRATPNRLHMAQVGFEVLIMARKLASNAESKVRGYLERF